VVQEYKLVSFHEILVEHLQTKHYDLKLYGGLPFLILAAIFPLTFVLVDWSLRPWLSIKAHEILATLLVIAAWAAITWITTGWFLHFFNVASETTRMRDFLGRYCLAAIFFLLPGLPGDSPIYPLHIIVFVWGGAIGIALLWFTASLTQRQIIRGTVKAIAVMVAALGSARLLFMLLPLLLHIQAFLYAGAIQKVQPAEYEYDSQRATFFHELRDRSQKILTFDPSTLKPGISCSGGAISGSIEITASIMNSPAPLDIRTVGRWPIILPGSMNWLRTITRRFLQERRNPPLKITVIATFRK
jgi:hypothetical protein